MLEGASPSGLLLISNTSTMQKGSWHFWEEGERSAAQTNMVCEGEWGRKGCCCSWGKLSEGL